MTEVKLILGDALAVLREMEPGSVDAVVTDPPYGIDGGRGGDSRLYGKGKYLDAFPDTEEYIADVVIPIIRQLIVDVPRVAVTPGIRCLHLYPRATDIGCFWTPASVTHGPWGFTCMQPILYYGKDWRAGRGPLPSGRQVTERAEKNGHPCPKPIDAWAWLVDKVAPPGAIILDPFMGSGTTGVACVQTGRRFVGCEIDPTYYAIAQKRIAQAQAQPPLIPHEAMPQPVQNGLLEGVP